MAAVEGDPIPQGEKLSTEHRVYYSLSSAMLIAASGEDEASEKVFAELHGLIGKMGRAGLTAQEVKQVQLDRAEIEIDFAEAIPNESRSTYPIEKTYTPQEAFEITDVSRADLEGRGFDVSQVTDEEMEELASRMADDYLEQLYWSSLDTIAEVLGVPKKRP